MEEIKEYFGYIYITINTINKKIYIGQSINKKRSRVYLGSGKLIRRAIEKYGRENFENAKIDFAFSQEELCKKEIFHIKWFRDNGFQMYNISTGGEFGDCYTNNPELQEYMKSETYSKNVSKALLTSKKFQEVIHSKEHREKLSISKTGLKSKRDFCIYCHKEYALGILTQFHNEHCYKNPNIDIEAERLRRKRNPFSNEGRKNISEGQKKSEKWQKSIHSKERGEKVSKSLLASEKFQTSMKSKKRIEKISINFTKNKIKCDHCEIITTSANIEKWHNNHYYNNPNIDKETERQRRFDLIKKSNDGRK